MYLPPTNLHVMRDTTGVIVVRDTATWEILLTLPERESDISSVSWSPDGYRIASGHLDGTVSLWDVKSGTEYRRMGGHAGRVTQVSWSRDGYHLATACSDGTIKLWNADTGQPLQEFMGRRDAMRTTTWSELDMGSDHSYLSTQEATPETLYFDGELPPHMIAHFPVQQEMHESKFWEVGWIPVVFIAAIWVFILLALSAG